MENEKRIRVKAMCLLIDNDRVLVADGTSMKSDTRPIVPDKFYRVLGGSLNFDESSEDGVRREIREELNSEIEDLTLLNVIENRFIYADEKGHDVVFMFKGALARKEVLNQPIVHIVEDGYEFDAVWVSIQQLLTGSVPLYPAADYSKFLQ